MRALRGLPVALLLLASACVYGSGPNLAGSNLGGIAPLLAGALRPFSDCEGFLSYVKGHGLEHVTPWGLPGGPWSLYTFDGVAVAEEAAPETALRGAAPAPGVDYSGTNVQVAGVDEPDIVKTDGERLVALARGRLFLVDLSGAAPELRGSLRLGDFWARDLLLLGDRVLLLGETGDVGIPVPLLEETILPDYGGPITALVEVDLSDPERPRIARRLLLDGRYLSARMVDGVARVVVSSYPTGLPFVVPEGGGLRAEREALEENRRVIRESTLESWVPYYVLEDDRGETLTEGPLLDCASAFHPPEFSGFGMLTVLTLDLSVGLDAATDRSVGVLADGETVYASASSLYVATQQWVDWQALEVGGLEPFDEGFVTRIHRFDISGADRARYRASGEVPGWLLNQFSMDEHEGFLRVASTDEPPFGGAASESTITVLAERDGRLAEVGRVSGLGKGERIFAVRFLGDRGYVVTFRQVDPLYVVDLSDPTRPSVEGELKIRGYSAYLHPLANDLLLGVGQDATRQGRVKGTQLSMFDVSDPAAPSRIDAVQVSGASSAVEWDHHAFLYWEPEGLVVVPVNVYEWEAGPDGKPFSGAMAVRVRDGDLEIEARLSQPTAHKGGWEIVRSLVVGGLLLTVSEAGIEAADLGSLEDVAWVPFE